MNWGAKVSLLIAALIVAVIAAWAIATQPWQSGTKDTTTKPQPTTSNKSEQPKSAVTIIFTDDGFSSATYTVRKGEVVTVTNKSSMELQFSSDNHPTHTQEPELNMDVLAPGQSGTFTPTEVGTWTFHDHINSQFTGTLKVTE